MMERSDTEAWGLHEDGGSVHLSRTLMFEDLSSVMNALTRNPAADVRRLIVDENLLGKPTGSTRRISYLKLERLYGLSARPPLFRLFQNLWVPSGSRPLLASLVAQARDPVFRDSWALIRRLPAGQALGASEVEAFLAASYGDRLAPATRRSASRSLRSSWTQCGYLVGHAEKVRVRPSPDAEVLTLALWLAGVLGAQDQRLFDSPWLERLELDAAGLEKLLRRASQKGYVSYRNAGGVVELGVSLDV